MHELSIALSLLDLAAEECERQLHDQLLALHIKVGPLSGVVKEALLSAYELARAQGPFQDVELVIEETPILAHCPTCRGDQAVASPQELCCAACGTPAEQIVSGRELELVALEYR